MVRLDPHKASFTFTSTAYSARNVADAVPTIVFTFMYLYTRVVVINSIPGTKKHYQRN